MESSHATRGKALLDRRGDTVTGASPEALHDFETALAAFQSWRGGAEGLVRSARDAAPGFVMAHVLEAWLAACSRDPWRVRSAAASHRRAAALPASTRESAHVAAIGAVLADDYPGARAVLDALLADHPRDVLALQVAHAFDYVAGDVAQLAHRVAGVLPAWSPALPGFSAVLAMHAFGLAETGLPAAASASALRALALDPGDARAHHAMAHVFEMACDPCSGLAWLQDHVDRWSGDTAVATHGWWHMALFHVASGATDRALDVYDRRVAARGLVEVSDLVDAAALLWRLELRGVGVGARWEPVADGWAPHLEDRFCSFNDVHAMLALVGARRWNPAHAFARELEGCAGLPTRHGESTRALGLPVCLATLAFGRGDYARAGRLLRTLPQGAARLGGSHAQRDVLELTRQEARRRAAWPPPRLAA